jgi:hypothetical protein
MTTTFHITDLTTGATDVSSGAPGRGVTTLDLTGTGDSYSVAVAAPNVEVMTGAGNDTIDLSHTTEANIAAPGAGYNIVIGGVDTQITVVADGSTTALENPQPGDIFTLYGVASTQTFVNGSNITVLCSNGTGTTTAIQFLGLGDPRQLNFGSSDPGDTAGPRTLVSVQVPPTGAGTPITTANEAEVYRLYNAAFGRAPDAAGDSYWVGQMDSGASIWTLGQLFAGSAEFVGDYASLNTNDFVATMYEHILHRQGEAAGMQAWSQALNSGQMNRGVVLVGFSDSAENRALTAPATNGN